MATLVGMLKATTKYNPLNNIELAQKRRNCLTKMERYGYISKSELDSFQDLRLNSTMSMKHTQRV